MLCNAIRHINQILLEKVVAGLHTQYHQHMHRDMMTMASMNQICHISVHTCIDLNIDVNGRERRSYGECMVCSLSLQDACQPLYLITSVVIAQKKHLFRSGATEPGFSIFP